ncbi:PIN/TRAM domain-containing protein [Proteiniclasticum sp. QWL-01]|uniref:PIN/TRAM domain-containing protein n=1 Tax=Proteiniclasticum sp. QWL-01 TaxID=3036945 RepID=UPI002410C292|nr:PIN/TRAM domain-containing protein [Proteiniclasticum sp. QWL-01]WFF73218.1 PIN/TRAM domain-containing protein [Proteiniclasticum sp. QWL-01]
MLKNILKAIFVLIGAASGWLLGVFLLSLEFIKPIGITQNVIAKYSVNGILALLLAFIFFILSPIFIRYIIRMVEAVDKNFQKMALAEVFLGAVGGLLALSISYLLATKALYGIRYVGSALALLVNVLAFFIGANIAIKKRDELTQMFSNLRTGKLAQGKGASTKRSDFDGEPKVLDTSVIIDGRIFDICQTGFVEGTLVIPNFVLEELRHIADSSDSLKRNRGRRGLDILNKIQKELDIEVRIWDREVKEAREVDVKLLKLAKEIGGKVVTNDYNLNKVAEFQGVPVLNINELANAVKPVLLPGEELSILVAKIGKEQNQGIGYLDDGTMIVIENGRRYVNETIDVIVTSVLQTAAGRMIFARPKD